MSIAVLAASPRVADRLQAFRCTIERIRLEGYGSAEPVI
jgi:hypothetical protein